MLKAKWSRQELMDELSMAEIELAKVKKREESDLAFDYSERLRADTRYRTAQARMQRHLHETSSLKGEAQMLYKMQRYTAHHQSNSGGDHTYQPGGNYDRFVQQRIEDAEDNRRVYESVMGRKQRL